MNKRKMKGLSVFLVIFLFVTLPFASALQISNVQATTTSNTATITWETDEPADSIVYYGDKSKGDSAAVTKHSVFIPDLKPSTKYDYTVESNNVKSEKSSFTTKEPDTTAPEITVEIPSFIKSNTLELKGTTEVGAEVSLFVNGQVADKSLAKDGTFVVKATVAGNVESLIKLEAVDPSGNKGVTEGKVFVDTKRPVITLSALPKIITETKVTLKGTVSEKSSIKIEVNNKSVANFEGEIIDKQITLPEGKSSILITAVDQAGWDQKKKLEVEVDSKAPIVKFDLTSGTEYFEGRAETDITGTAEPGAKVFLYVFRPRVDDYRLNFKKALMSTTADSEGNFKFEDVDFSASAITKLEDLAPREVPNGLQEILLPRLDEIAASQRLNYRIYVLAEDKTGKVGHAFKQIYVNSCSSPHFAYNIFPPEQFPPQPFRLDPQLMDDGRQTISAVYNVTYQGGVQGKYDPVKNRYEPGHRILNVRFQKACTKKTADTDEYSFGCKLLPSQNLNAQQVTKDKSMWYLSTSLLRSSDFIDLDDDLWKEFQKRMIKMPLKILVTYQEWQPETKGWSQSKTQVACRDLQYFTDFALDGSPEAADFLVDEAVDGIDFVVRQTESIQEILEPIVFYTGVSCYTSWLAKSALKVNRFVKSYYNHYTKKDSKGKKDGCPAPSEQKKLILESTWKEWDKIKGVDKVNLPAGWDNKDNLLDKRCPSAASAWELEAKFDSVYKAVCDRFFCRAVPARWTEDKTVEQIKKVQLEQQACAVSGACQLLTPVENCQKLLKKNVAASEYLVTRKTNEPFTCWRDTEGVLYYRCNSDDKDPACADKVVDLQAKGIWRLKPVLVPSKASKDKILVIAADKNGPACGALDISCKQQCDRRLGFSATNKGYKLDKSKQTVVSGASGACFKEVTDGSTTVLKGQGDKTVGEGAYKGGYTNDCFIDQNTRERYQCVCERDEGSKAGINTRTAIKKKGELEESFRYRQDALYHEAGAGTYYPPERYYEGRDFTGAFGFNHMVDIIGEPTIAKINPRDYTDAWQSLCLRNIQGQLTLLQSFLTQARNCLDAAKNSELSDAGTCKTFFTQGVCSLVYKGISSLTNKCSPVTFEDAPEGTQFQKVGSLWTSLKRGIPQGLKSSASDLKRDYGASAAQQFRVGTEGIVTSMCLAALGYDFPTDFDFLTDPVYASPMKTSVKSTFARREFTSFDPIRGVPRFTYTLGTGIIPGCRIRGYRTTLKCIGPEDLGKPNVDQSCDGKGCDCLAISADQSALSGERTKVVPSGTKFSELPRFQVHDIDYANPLTINSNYRYDHYIVEVFLDGTQDPKECFDDGYQTSNGGIFYFPLSHVEGKKFAQCQADPATGRFVCPELVSFFKGGNTYFEHPFMRCLDKDSDEFVDCKTPNILIEGNDIIIKPYINVGKGGACLRVTDSRGKVQETVQIPEHIVGPYRPPLKIGRVTADMVGGGNLATIIRRDTLSEANCGGNGKQVNVLSRPQNYGNTKTLPFTYEKVGNLYKLRVDNVDVEFQSSGFSMNANRWIIQGSTEAFSSVALNDIQFKVDGFVFKDVLGQPQKDKGKCEYQTVPTLSNQKSKVGIGSVNVKVELLQAPQGGSCFNAKELVPASSLGTTTHSQIIRVQSQKEQQQIVSDFHGDFMNGNYPRVIRRAEQIAQGDKNNVDDVTARYYWATSLLMQNKNANKVAIKGVIRSFLDKNYAKAVEDSAEYVKVEKYLCEIDRKELGGELQDKCHTLCETSPSTKNTHVCKDTTGMSDTSSCKIGWCENSILTARGIANAGNYKCCPK